jgi:hypothetical protein
MDQPAERQTSCTSSALSFIAAVAMQKMTPFAISVRSLVGMIDSSQALVGMIDSSQVSSRR